MSSAREQKNGVQRISKGFKAMSCRGNNDNWLARGINGFHTKIIGYKWGESLRYLII